MLRKISVRKLATLIERFTLLFLDAGGLNRRNARLEEDALEQIDILSDPSRASDDHQLVADR